MTAAGVSLTGSGTLGWTAEATVGATLGGLTLFGTVSPSISRVAQTGAQRRQKLSMQT